jgi:hypothetical protein
MQAAASFPTTMMSYCIDELLATNDGSFVLPRPQPGFCSIFNSHAVMHAASRRCPTYPRQYERGSTRKHDTLPVQVDPTGQQDPHRQPRAPPSLTAGEPNLRDCGRAPQLPAPCSRSNPVPCSRLSSGAPCCFAHSHRSLLGIFSSASCVPTSSSASTRHWSLIRRAWHNALPSLIVQACATGLTGRAMQVGGDWNDRQRPPQQRRAQKDNRMERRKMSSMASILCVRVQFIGRVGAA